MNGRDRAHERGAVRRVRVQLKAGDVRGRDVQGDPVGEGRGGFDGGVNRHTGVSRVRAAEFGIEEQDREEGEAVRVVEKGIMPGGPRGRAPGGRGCGCSRWCGRRLH